MHIDALNEMTDFCFDIVPDRNDMGCAKWNRRTAAEKAAGIIPLSIADMEFQTAPCVIDALAKLVKVGSFGYADIDDTYNAAVAGWMERRHGWRIAKEWIVPQNGVVPAISVAIRAFTEPGDAVLMFTPRYSPFEHMVVVNDRIPVYSELKLRDDQYYAMDLDDFAKKAADSHAKLLIFCSPHNPTGRIWTAEELRAVAAICNDNNMLVISDEIHHDIQIYGKHSIFCEAVPEMQDHCVILTAPSKTFSIAGLQLANTIIPNEALRGRYRLQREKDGYSNPSLFGYHAMVAAYTKGDAWVDAMTQYIRSNFEMLDAWLREHLPMVRMLPVQGTYLAWLDWRALGLDDAALLKRTRGDAMVILNDGSSFGPGGSGFLRMNLALPRAELCKALDRLHAAVANR